MTDAAGIQTLGPLHPDLFDGLTPLRRQRAAPRKRASVAALEEEQ